MALGAVDSVNAAFEHTKQQLFLPFRLGQWARLAFVGFLAGELTSFSCRGNIPSAHAPHRGGGVPHIDPALVLPIVLLVVIAVPVIGLIYLYVNSRMRFVLFDSIVARSASIRRMWNARGGPALQFFSGKLFFL